MHLRNVKLHKIFFDNSPNPTRLYLFDPIVMLHRYFSVADHCSQKNSQPRLALVQEAHAMLLSAGLKQEYFLLETLYLTDRDIHPYPIGCYPFTFDFGPGAF
jgi:hypothetical protein